MCTCLGYCVYLSTQEASPEARTFKVRAASAIALAMP
jgi:hypothetical protein